MGEPLTHYGTKDASNLMYGFHKVGNTKLEELLDIYSAPKDRKTLRTWKMKEACELIGRSEAYIRKLESSSPEYKAEIEGNARYYTLDLINRIRDKAGTRYKRPIGSSPIILAVSNFKGGVAKSTTALHLAQKAAIEGLRVLCIDLDPQATFTLGFGYIPDIHLEAKDTIKNALSESPDLIKASIQKTYFDGIDIIPGNLSISELDILLTNPSQNESLLESMGMPDIRLKKALSLVEDKYDLIVLDCGPNLGMLTINAVTAANALLVPIPPMMSDFGSFVTFTGTLGALFESMGKNFDFFRVLLTKHPESKEAKNIEFLMRESFGNYMLLNHCLMSVEVEKASATFGSVYEMTKSSSKPYKRAIESLNNVFDEILDAFKNIWGEQSKEMELGNVDDN